jgi:hypothetical protein
LALVFVVMRKFSDQVAHSTCYPTLQLRFAGEREASSASSVRLK